MRRLLISLPACAMLLSASGIAGQSAASPFVPAGHWSAAAVDRLQALGVAPAGTVRGQSSRTVAEVRVALAAGARSGHPAARDYLLRFDEEFGAKSGSVLTHASVAGGAATRRGDATYGVYTTWGEENWTGVRPREDRTAAAGSAALLAGFGEHIAAGVVAGRGLEYTRLEELYGLAGLGPVAVWAGRRIQGYGPGTGGLVLNGPAPIDGGGVYLAEPLRLPWVLRHLGPVRADLTVGVLDRNGPVARPYYVLTRGSIEPHPRLGFGLTRAGMIGVVNEDVSFVDVLVFLVGSHTDGSEFDNQVAAVDAWFRPPAGSLPLLLYIEWGAEDSAGSWWDVPGIVAGAEVAAVPGVPWLSLLAEHATFAASKSGNPPWYRHPIGFHEGWSTRGELLGHPLGGHGREWLLQARANLLEGRLQLTTRGFLRDRSAENVYAPERSGGSSGIAAGGHLQLNDGIIVHVKGSTDGGSGWRTTRLSGSLQLYLPRRVR